MVIGLGVGIGIIGKRGNCIGNGAVCGRAGSPREANCMPCALSIAFLSESWAFFWFALAGGTNGFVAMTGAAQFIASVFAILYAFSSIDIICSLGRPLLARAL